MRGALAAELSADLDVPVEIAVAREPAPISTLAPGETRFAASLSQREARDTWLRGRAALKALVPGDTSTLVFPHRRLSLAHSAGTAVAVRSPAPLVGIGVDFEPWRASVQPVMARFFLRLSEQDAARTPRRLVRLWTIKEALFKAHPDNHQCILLDFELSDPAAGSGTATGPSGRVLRYATADVVLGSFAVAVTLRGKRVPV